MQNAHETADKDRVYYSSLCACKLKKKAYNDGSPSKSEDYE